MTPKISKELVATVAALAHIQKVYFTASGEHFFNVHEYREKGSNAAPQLYGRLGVKPVVSRVEGDRKIYKNVSVPLEQYRIVHTMTREEILAATPEAAAAAKGQGDISAKEQELAQREAELKMMAEDMSEKVSIIQAEQQVLADENAQLKAELEAARAKAAEAEKLKAELESLKKKGSGGK